MVVVALVFALLRKLLLSKGGSGTVSRGEYLRNKYGTLTKEELNNRINLRQGVHDELDRLKASGISNNKLGPMLAGVYDQQTGRYYFGINDLKVKLLLIYILY